MTVNSEDKHQAGLTPTGGVRQRHTVNSKRASPHRRAHHSSNGDHLCCRHAAALRNAVAHRQTHKADGTSLPSLTCQDPGLPALPRPAWQEGGQPEAAALTKAYSIAPQPHLYPSLCPRIASVAVSSTKAPTEPCSAARGQPGTACGLQEAWDGHAHLHSRHSGPPRS